MRTLLTGSSGWLGRFLAPRLKARGHRVVGLDIAAGVDTQIVGSVADRNLIERTVADHDIDAIIHAGALHKPDIARYGAQAFVDVNVTGTLNLLETAVKARHKRFLFTSTTSLMISELIRKAEAETAIWLDETTGPLEPRNIYGVTKLAAENLCRLFAKDHGIACTVLRTGRFFPEEDDTIRGMSGENLKAVELLHRRLTVEDAADGHIAALERSGAQGFEVFLLSAPTPFDRSELGALKTDAAAVIARHFPEAPRLFAERGWILPSSIDRVYDSSRAARDLPFRCRTGFADVLKALRDRTPLPFVHDADYLSPKEAKRLP